jgi:hypothetical protein
MGYLTRVALGPRRFYGEVPTRLSALDLRATNLHPSRRFQKSLMTPPLRTLYQGAYCTVRSRAREKRLLEWQGDRQVYGKVRFQMIVITYLDTYSFRAGNRFCLTAISCRIGYCSPIRFRY